jgi:hypothetical protein
VFREASKTSIEDDPAPLLLQEFGEACCREVPRRVFEADPLGSVRGTLLAWILVRYLARLGNLRDGDAALASEIIEETSRYLRSEIARVAFLALSGLEPDSERLETGQVCVRELTPDEIGRLSDPYPNAVELMDPPYRMPELGWDTAAVEARVRSAGSNDAELTVAKLLLGFQLLGFSPHTTKWIEQWTEPSPSRHYSARPAFLPETGESKTVTIDDFRKAHAISQLIPDEAITRPRNTRDVALHRFSRGCSRSSHEDSHIDFVIALESILLTGQKSELSFRFRMFGAHFLTAPNESRREVSEELKKIYDLRSDLVHGSKFPKHETIVAVAPRLRELTARALVKCLTHKWPTEHDGIAALLG